MQEDVARVWQSQCTVGSIQPESHLCQSVARQIVIYIDLADPCDISSYNGNWFLIFFLIFPNYTGSNLLKTPQGSI